MVVNDWLLGLWIYLGSGYGKGGTDFDTTLADH